jgi:WD40 repeat protein
MLRSAPYSVVNALGFSRDASVVLVASANGVYGFDVATTQRMRTFGDRTHATGVAVSADGQTVVVASKQVDYYRFSDAAHLATFGQTGFVWEGAFAADGRYQFTGAAGPVQVWDPTRGVRLLSVERPSLGNQGKVIFAPNGSLLINHEATGSYWDVAQGNQILSFDYQTTSVRPALHQVVFSRDGEVLISEGTLPDLGHIQFWDAANGQLLRTIPAYGYARRAARHFAQW